MLVLILILALCRGVAMSQMPLYDSILMSGTATNSLLQAFRAFPGNARELQAPFILSTYSVQLLHHADEDTVAFYPKVGRFPFVAHLKGGRVIAQDSVQPALDVQPIVIPGVIAGEIVATYAKASQENDVVASRDPTTFDVGVEILAGGALIGFIPKVLPEYYRTHVCVTGNCNGRSVYQVQLDAHTVSITRRIVL